MLPTSSYNVSCSGFLAFSPSNGGGVRVERRGVPSISRMFYVFCLLAFLLAGAFFYLVQIQALEAYASLLARREKEYNELRQENIRLASGVRAKISFETSDSIGNTLLMEKAQAQFITQSIPIFVAK